MSKETKEVTLESLQKEVEFIKSQMDFQNNEYRKTFILVEQAFRGLQESMGQTQFSQGMMIEYVVNLINKSEVAAGRSVTLEDMLAPEQEAKEGMLAVDPETFEKWAEARLETMKAEQAALEEEAQLQAEAARQAREAQEVNLSED